jgi:hypothetical protein
MRAAIAAALEALARAVLCGGSTRGATSRGVRERCQSGIMTFPLTSLLEQPVEVH